MTTPPSDTTQSRAARSGDTGPVAFLCGITAAGLALMTTKDAGLGMFLRGVLVLVAFFGVMNIVRLSSGPAIETPRTDVAPAPRWASAVYGDIISLMAGFVAAGGVLLATSSGSLGTLLRGLLMFVAFLLAKRLISGVFSGTDPVTPAPAARKKATSTPAPVAAPAKAPEPVADTSAAAVTGTRPEALSAARDGQGDDLTRIRGVGPKLSALCNTLGFYHFDQIAAWTDEEIAWVDENLETFRGRVTRDDWVVQARALMNEDRG